MNKHKANLLSVQQQILKMRADMEKEEKLAMKDLEKNDELDYLEYQKEQMVK